MDLKPLSHFIVFTQEKNCSASGMVAMDLSGKNSINWIAKGHSSMMNYYGVSELGNIKTSHLLGSPSLMHDTGFAADWSSDEQRILEDGLIKFVAFFLFVFCRSILSFCRCSCLHRSVLTTQYSMARLIINLSGLLMSWRLGVTLPFLFHHPGSPMNLQS